MRNSGAPILAEERSGCRSAAVIDVTGGVLFNGRNYLLGAIRVTVGAGS